MERKIKSLGLLTEHQIKWLEDILSNYDVLVVTLHGSHLYGLEREGSDVDIKAVYLPTMEQFCSGDRLKVLNKKCEELDIDVELKPIDSFLRSLKSFDTNCIDMLHTPEDKRFYSTDLWDQLFDNRKSIYAKDARGMISYIRSHTHKYSNKKERLEVLKTMRDLCDEYDLNNNTISDIMEDFQVPDDKYVKVALIYGDSHSYLEVCGKKYIATWKVSQLKEAMIKECDRYGHRSNNSIKEGYDSKSLSHALRVLYEVRSMLLYDDIVFPLKEKDIVKKVKLGEMEIEEVINLIDKVFDQVTLLLSNTNLKEKPDMSKILSIIVNSYK